MSADGYEGRHRRAEDYSVCPWCAGEISPGMRVTSEGAHPACAEKNDDPVAAVRRERQAAEDRLAWAEKHVIGPLRELADTDWRRLLWGLPEQRHPQEES